MKHLLGMLWTNFIWALPRKLIYWAIIRAWSFSTQVYSNRTPDEISIGEMLECWEKKGI